MLYFEKEISYRIRITPEIIDWLNENYLSYDNQEISNDIYNLTDEEKATLENACDELYDEIMNAFLEESTYRNEMYLMEKR